MKQSSKVWLLALLLIFSTTSLVVATPLKCDCHDEDRLLSVTNPLMTGDDVLELQTLLAALDFYQGELDGVYNEASANAVKDLQAWAGLEQNGTFGPKEQEAITISTAHNSLVTTAPAPPPGELRIEIDVNKRTLTVLVDDNIFKVFPCAVGKTSTKSPVGEWRVIQKGTHWGGGFGTRWMGLNVPWGIYGIHGTNKPGSIGTAASHGCIRMFNRDVEQLYPWVKVGTRVSIIGPYPKVAITRALKPGVSGVDVQILQLSLRDAGFNSGFTDGRFGKDTEAAIKDLQAYYGLRPTGQADANVLALLGLR